MTTESQSNASGASGAPSSDESPKPAADAASPGQDALPAGEEPVVAGPAAAPRPGGSYFLLSTVTLVTLVADLWSKQWAEQRLDPAKGNVLPVEVISGYLDFSLARNHGGAWGLFQDTSESIRRPFFFVFSIVAIGFILSLFRKLAPNQHALRWGLPLVLGGALGNLVDRLRYSYVVDFIHMHATWGGRDHSWPTYNVADIAICVGVGLMALDMFAKKKDVALPPEPATAGAAADAEARSADPGQGPHAS